MSLSNITSDQLTSEDHVDTVDSAPEATGNAIPSHLKERTKPKVNLKFIVGGVVLLLLAVLIVQATITTGAYYLTVDEVLNSDSTMVGQRIRVSGHVVDGSEDWNAQEVTLKFAIHEEDSAPLTIVFKGPRPDNFHRAAEAIVEGELLADGTFQADNLLLKCPSRYDEEPEEIYVEATG